MSSGSLMSLEILEIYFELMAVQLDKAKAISLESGGLNYLQPQPRAI